MKNFSGHCACGEIKLEIETTKANVVNCHCNRCRKLNGSSFSTYIVVSGKRVMLTKGEEFITSYSPSEYAVKNFCKNCGTPIFNQNLKYPHLKMVHLGAVNTLEEIKPNMNIFCQSRLSWISLDETLANFDREIE